MEKHIASLVQDAGQVQSAPSPLRLWLKWMGVAAVYIALSLVILGVRPDLLAALHNGLFAAEILLLIGIVATTALSATLLAFPDMYQHSRLVLAPIVMFVLFIGVIFLAWQADNPPAPPPVHSFECSLTIAVLALLPAAWMFYSMRRLASTHRRSAGVVVMLAAFSIGAITLRLSEQTNSIMHVIEWHYVPMIVVALLGVWLGKVLLRW
ncbi:DUF1109 domain-containing protein [Sulfuriferula sp. AH1]|uniref:DUF1109 domain-containing protein n=1 Tax=Sulfuriferula sp. AH1 TaxID=1985873 RepID=UPI001CB90F53|nr:DUF1109 domain-containing protein [Sulfuriferula sp. AH1]